MTGPHWSSPFGARPLAAAPLLAELTLRGRQAALVKARAEGADGNGAGRVADKWQLLRALSEARGRFHLSDRTICVLEALLSFHAGKELDGGAPVIVFPSNRELSLRSRGMAPATLRRHLAALVAAGLVLRRDSPNGKRFRRAGFDGEEAEAFGFDVSPLALRAGHIFEAAEEERRAARAAARLRSAISIHRRDIAKLLDAAMTENRAGPFEAIALRLADLAKFARSQSAPSELALVEQKFARLRAEAETAYLAALGEEELSANDAENERHYQNSKAEPPTESKAQEKNGEAGEGGVATKARSVDLGRVLRACPDISLYAKSPPRSWPEFLASASLVRGFLGISADAWRSASEAMGEPCAAAVLACILQRADRIRSPGGYLRDLTDKARCGRFTLEPMLKALEP